MDTLPETNRKRSAPENGWLEDDFPFWETLFPGAFAVSFREGNIKDGWKKMGNCPNVNERILVFRE